MKNSLIQLSSFWGAAHTDFANSTPKFRKLSPIKKEAVETRGLLTKEYIEENIHLVNPQHGKMNCLKCAISGYRWIKHQTNTPEKVNTRGPKDDNYFPNRNERDIDLIDFQQASLLPSGKIQLTENGESWTEEFYIEDSKPITFKQKSIEEFNTLLRTMEFLPWNNVSSRGDSSF